MLPGAGGTLIVTLDGQKIFDRKAENGRYPSLTDIRAWKKPLREKLEALAKAETPAKAEVPA